VAGTELSPRRAVRAALAIRLTEQGRSWLESATAMCAFYTGVFDWSYHTGSAGFNYVHFPVQERPLLGGIGQSADSPGQRPGAYYYLLVPDLAATLEKVVAYSIGLIE
jgi:predicted enzyme related to lactoylglutathione lyase